MYSDEDLIQLSALQHVIFCPRQCALIHIEHIWSENRLTAEGRIMHERVHEVDYASRGNVRVEYGVPLRSLKLGLIGKADVIEFHRQPDNTWSPFPIEYKRGKPKGEDCDRIQLCAQAMCIEEMQGIRIQQGALFYGRTRRRQNISFNDTLRRKTEDAAIKVRELIEAGKTPAPFYTERCNRCSIVKECLPKIFGKKPAVAAYLSKALKDL